MMRARARMDRLGLTYLLRPLQGRLGDDGYAFLHSVRTTLTYSVVIRLPDGQAGAQDVYVFGRFEREADGGRNREWPGFAIYLADGLRSNHAGESDLGS